jgi:hypothetical protein
MKQVLKVTEIMFIGCKNLKILNVRTTMNNNNFSSNFSADFSAWAHQCLIVRKVQMEGSVSKEVIKTILFPATYFIPISYSL